MQQALRPYATAGVVIVGASLIAATPMAPRLPDIQMREVALTAGEDTLPDLLTPWIDVYNAASENSTTLLNNFGLAPFVDLQQMIANDAGYLQDFFNDPTSSTVATISSDMQANLASVLDGFSLQDVTSTLLREVVNHTMDSAHATLFESIASYLPSDINPAEVTPIIDFLGSPLSGMIMGFIGPEISPWVALINSIDAGDSLNETVANMVGGFFNGATLNLDSLLPLINDAGVFPGGMNMTNLDIAFGGLFSDGSVASGPYELFNSSGDVTTSIPAVGGSIFESLGVEFTGVPIVGSIGATSEAIGPIGAMESWEEIVAGLLGGSGWDGKGAAGVTAPLTGVTLPVIPDDFLDAGATGSAAAADLSSLVQDIISGLSL